MILYGADHAVLLPFNPDLHRRTFGRILDRVGEQILEHDFEQRRIGLHPAGRGVDQHDRDPFFAGKWLHSRHHRFERRSQPDLHDGRFHRAEVVAGEQQELVDQPGHPVQLGEAGVDPAFVVFDRSRLTHQHFERSLHDGQRRFQLVRRIRRELLFALERLLEAVEQRVHRDRHSVEFVTVRRERNTLVEVRLGDRFSRGDHFVDWPYASPGYQPRQHEQHDDDEGERDDDDGGHVAKHEKRPPDRHGHGEVAVDAAVSSRERQLNEANRGTPDRAVAEHGAGVAPHDAERVFEKARRLPDDAALGIGELDEF